MKAQTYSFWHGFMGGYALQPIFLVLLLIYSIRCACLGKPLSPGLYYGAAFAFSGTLAILILSFSTLKYIGRMPDRVIMTLDSHALDADNPEQAERLSRELINVPFLMNSKYLDDFHQCNLAAILVYLVSIIFSLMIGATLSLRHSMYESGSSGWFGESHDYYVGKNSSPRHPTAISDTNAECVQVPTAGPSRQTTLNGSSAPDQDASLSPALAPMPAMLLASKPTEEAFATSTEQETSVYLQIESDIHVISPTESSKMAEPDPKQAAPNSLRKIAPNAHFSEKIPTIAVKKGGKRRPSYSK